MSRISSRMLLALLLPLALALGLAAARQSRQTPGERPDGSALVPTNQTLTPLGTVRKIEGARPKDSALSPDSKILAVLCTGRVALFGAGGEPLGAVSARTGALGIAWSPDGSALYASGDDGKVRRLEKEGDAWKVTAEIAVEAEGARGRRGRGGNPQVNGLAVAPDGMKLYAALGIRNVVAVIDLPTREVTASVPVGVAPYHLALSPDGRTLCAANRGGKRVRAGEDTAPSAGTPVRIDQKTDAAQRGSLSFIDTETLRATEIEAGRQPSGMIFSPDGGTLYVANSDEDTLSFVNVGQRRIARTLALRPPEDPGFGQIPTDVALSGDGKTLYAACGGGNAVAVVSLEARPQVQGYLPTGWYPIALESRGGALFVANAKGIGARRPNNQGKFGVYSSVGTVQFLPNVAQADLVASSRRVAENNRWGRELPARPNQPPVPIPERVGEPSLFKRVVYIIKENLTYDSLLGDMPEGRGDKSLCLFGEEVSPNHHALAREFVLLDNTYTSGTNSADGHQWTSSSVANGYVEQNYSAHLRSYPYDGGDPLAYSPEGFLWTAARRAGKSVRVYGEFVNKPRVTDPATGRTPTWKELWLDYKAGTNRYRITADTDNAALKPLLHPRFIGFPTIVSDQWRADQYLQELAEWEQNGKMPELSILLLPNDHTTGTTPDYPTPRASVADNDLALGRIVEALSKSRFWKETLILVIEDDSQLGLDHIDGHRTVAFCISPYTKRGIVASAPYNHTSFLRTMGLVLGFPAMNRFDRSATSLTDCFTPTPDLRPYAHRANRVPLDEMNPQARALRGEARRLAEASAKLNWSDVDRADAGTVARAAWLATQPGKPFPARSFKPNFDEDEDD